jgi:hypothetical protein
MIERFYISCIGYLKPNMLREICVCEKGKGDGSKRTSSRGTVSALAVENRVKPRTASVKTVSVPVQFRTD